MEEKYIYYDRGGDYNYKEIKEEYLKSNDSFKNYFGYIDDQFDENNEIVVYKLVLFKTFKKETSYKFKE